MGFARGKYAYGFCDRCGFRYPLHRLKSEVQDRADTGFRVCPVCFDEDQPQQWVGEQVLDDPKPLRDPRPDPAMQASRRLFSWNPIGGGVYQFGNETLALKMTASVGQASVNTSDVTPEPGTTSASASVGSVTVSTP